MQLVDLEQAEADIENLEEGDRGLAEELSREYDEDGNTSDWAYHIERVVSLNTKIQSAMMLVILLLYIVKSSCHSIRQVILCGNVWGDMIRL